MPQEVNISAEYVQEYRKQLGAIIEEKMIDANINRDELACTLGVSLNTIRRIETGSFGLSIDFYIKAAIILNLKVSLT